MPKIVSVENYTTYQQIEANPEVLATSNQKPVVVFRSLPSVSAEGKPAFGAAGSTTLAKKLASELMVKGYQVGLVLTGEIMREYHQQIAFPNASDLEKAAISEAFYTWRAEVEAQKMYHHDQAVDQLVRERVAHLQTTSDVVIVDSKIFSDIPENRIQFPNQLVLGVQINDTVANQRLLPRDGITTDVATLRHQRYLSDFELYLKLYQADLSPDKISQRCHIIIDNSESWKDPSNPAELIEFTAGLINTLYSLWIIFKHAPTVALPAIQEAAT